jgi:hypothetical protein
MVLIIPVGDTILGTVQITAGVGTIITVTTGGMADTTIIIIPITMEPVVILIQAIRTLTILIMAEEIRIIREPEEIIMGLERPIQITTPYEILP